MYTQLTKIATIDGHECVTCVYYDTPTCPLHTNKNHPGCAGCGMMGAILNQLHEFEESFENILLKGEKSSEV